MFDLDGTELYGPDGQTIGQLENLSQEEINKLVEG